MCIRDSSGGIPELVTEECAIIVQRDAKLTEKLKDEMIKLALDNKLRESCLLYTSYRRSRKFYLDLGRLSL